VKAPWLRDDPALTALGLTPAEYAAVRSWMGPTTPETVDALWEKIGGKPDDGCILTHADLPQHRFLRVLLDRAEAEQRGHRGPKSWAPVRHALRRHGLEICAAALVVLAIAAIVRIAGAYANWWSAGLTPQVVSLRPLVPGMTLGRDDLSLAYLPRTGITPAAKIDDVIGRRVASAVPAGQVVRRDGLLARQVVARVPLASGSPIRSEHVRLEWSLERPDAVTDVKASDGKCSQEPVAAGAIILGTDLTTCP
jgi:Flp pilus assembly protein CpaB